MSEEFTEKLKTLNLKELNSAYGTAKMSSRLVTVFGVTLMFLMVTYFNIITLIVGSLFLYVASNIAVGIDETAKLIKKRIVEIADK